MATYITLNIIYMVLIGVVIVGVPRKPSRAWIIMIIVLIILTIVFDNLLIYLHIFSYRKDKILGMYIGNAPIEDFMYAILAAITIPVVWHKIGQTK